MGATPKYVIGAICAPLGFPLIFMGACFVLHFSSMMTQRESAFFFEEEMYGDFFMSILFYFSLFCFNIFSTSALFFLNLYNGYYLMLFYLVVSFIVEYIWTSGEFLPVLILLVIFALEITAVSFVLLAGLPWRPPSPSRPPS